MNNIGFEWRLQERNDWMEMYDRLVAFKKKHKHTRVPSRFDADSKLANWVGRQRQCCEEEVRIDLLNKIGFAWNGRYTESQCLL